MCNQTAQLVQETYARSGSRFAQDEQPDGLKRIRRTRCCMLVYSTHPTSHPQLPPPQREGFIFNIHDVYIELLKHCDSPLTSARFWAWAGVPLGVYNIVSDFNIALQIQPQILTCLSLTTWIQCYYYERNWSVSKALAVVLPVACVMGGFEAGLVFALRIGIQHGTQWPVNLMAVLAALFLALGVLEQYLAIWKLRSVAGISFLFCGIDAMGDLTSIISVVFQARVNVLGLVIYSVEFVLWMGIFAIGGYYKLFPWLKRSLQRRRPETTASHGDVDAQATGEIALHEMPSSTSVFRTPSADNELRPRTAVAPSSHG